MRLLCIHRDRAPISLTGKEGAEPDRYRGDREVFTGKSDGDEIKVWLDRQGPERGVVLQRVKD